MNRILPGAIVVAFAFALAACGGGGGTTLPTDGSTSTPASSPTPSQTPYSGPVSATGKLVDHETGNPLAGIQVGLAPWTLGATPIPQPSTDANGKFTVTAPSPGKYLLIIGSNLANDPNNRPTIHDAITIAGGATPQPLVAPTMPPPAATAPPNWPPSGWTGGPWLAPTPNPTETSGNYRLTTLAPAEQACLAYENQVRSGKGYAPIMPDEWLVENNRTDWLQDTIDDGLIAQGSVAGYNSGTLGADCKGMIDNAYTVSVNMGNPKLIWFAGDSGGAFNAALSEGMVDVRGPIPTDDGQPGGHPGLPNPWP